MTNAYRLAVARPETETDQWKALHREFCRWEREQKLPAFEFLEDAAKALQIAQTKFPALSFKIRESAPF